MPARLPHSPTTEGTTGSEFSPSPSRDMRYDGLLAIDDERRTSMSFSTCLTNACSKKVENHAVAAGLHSRAAASLIQEFAYLQLSILSISVEISGLSSIMRGAIGFPCVSKGRQVRLTTGEEAFEVAKSEYLRVVESSL